MKDKIIHLTNELNDLVFRLINDNTELKKQSEEKQKLLLETLFKLDKIKSITSDENVLKIVDEVL